MRSVLWTAILGILWTAGCARQDVQIRGSEWHAVCQRMRPDRSAQAPEQPGPALRDDMCEQLAKVARVASASVVTIHTGAHRQHPADQAQAGVRHASASSRGTGLIISTEGAILTNEHVIRSDDPITVVLSDRSSYPAEKAFIDSRLDLAVIRIRRDRLPAIRPSTESVETGSAVVAIAGTASSGSLPIRTGVVTSARISLQNELDPARRRDYGHLIESTVPLEAGFSGGPLLDVHGRLVGINVAVRGERRPACRGYAIPLNAQVRRLLADACSAPN
ncbi:MAG: hypothetical protein AMXMBFR13_50340 [Phycisphaerae bacterium]